MTQQNERKKVKLHKQSKCKHCGIVVGSGWRMISVSGKDEKGNRFYHHECDKCAGDWNAL